jgi:uncharacterized protein (DUF305 family)
MTGPRRFVILLVWISTFSLAAAAQGSRSQSESATANPEWSEFAANMNKMHAAMGSVELSGDSDADFVRLMLAHHQAAIDMARTQLMYGKDPQMRRLAQEIITDQQSEIELMQMWLKQHQGSSQRIDQTPALHAGKEH